MSNEKYKFDLTQTPKEIAQFNEELDDILHDNIHSDRMTMQGDDTPEAGKRYIFVSASRSAFVADFIEVRNQSTYPGGPLQDVAALYDVKDGYEWCAGWNGSVYNINDNTPYAAIEVPKSFPYAGLLELNERYGQNIMASAGYDVVHDFMDFVRTCDLGTVGQEYIEGIGHLDMLKSFGLTQKKLGELMNVKNFRNSSSKDRVLAGVCKAIVHVATAGALGGEVLTNKAADAAAWQAPNGTTFARVGNYYVAVKLGPKMFTGDVYVKVKEDGTPVLMRRADSIFDSNKIDEYEVVNMWRE